MKIFKVIFFHIYNSYYKNGNYSNDKPHLTAFGIVGCSFTFLFLFATASVNHVLHEDRLTKPTAFLTCIIGLLVAFLLFYYRRKYNRIYEEIKDTKYDTSTFKIIAWSVIFAGFTSLPLYSYLFNRVGS